MNYLELEAAMCAWEAFLETPTDAMKEFREDNGTVAARAVVGKFVPWILEGYDLNPDKWDCYDWDYVPFFMENCINWPRRFPRKGIPALKPNWKDILNA